MSFRVQDVYEKIRMRFSVRRRIPWLWKLSSNSGVNIYVIMSFAGSPLSSYPHPLDFGEERGTDTASNPKLYERKHQSD